ncbi:MAG: DUF167 domain-containing protein [Pyrinomonadaceae bacterium]|nr:DUF167 domain-containing protein [Pyrinomonadaceae bacterium]
MINFTEKDNAIIFAVRVIPRSSRSEIVGEYDGALKVKLNSPPIDGEANKELITLLAKTFHVSKSDIEIISGQTNKNKQVKIKHLSNKDLSTFEVNQNS